MPEIRFKKPTISIREIGVKRFWLGLIVGIFTAVVLSLAFNYGREVFRSPGVMRDLHIPSTSEFQRNNYFYVALSVTLAMSLTTWFWLYGKYETHGRRRLIKRLITTNTLLVFWWIILVVIRFGTLVMLLFSGLGGYDNDLEFTTKFAVMLILIPLYVFLQNWYLMRLLYRCEKWMGYSLLISIVGVYALVQTTTIDQDLINKPYLEFYESEYAYIEDEIERAYTQYGISFDDTTVHVLHKWYKPEASKQVRRVKSAFLSDNIVTLDTIMLAKIIQHNLKDGYAINYRYRWDYPYPINIYYQMNQYEPADEETIELMNLLILQIELFNTRGSGEPQTGRDYKIQYISSGKKDAIKVDLMIIRDRLLKDTSYNDYHKLLPSVSFELDTTFPMGDYTRALQESFDTRLSNNGRLEIDSKASN